jgi:hypothetical protein
MYARMPRTALHFYDHHTTVRGLPLITADVLKRELVLMRVLGTGGSGVAFKARFRGRDVVVKLPIRLLNHQFRLPPSGCKLTDVFLPNIGPPNSDFIQAHRVMELECYNAEFVLEPPSLRSLREREHAGLLKANRPVSDPKWQSIRDDALMRGLPPPSELTSRVRNALTKWRGYAGYQHMHPVIHYDRDIPLLMSEPAQDTIDALRFAVNANTRLPLQWLDVAWQLSEAICFLRDLPCLAHADIKPPNVLFVLLPTNRHHIWLSDYGDLYPMYKHTDFRQGTSFYKPDTSGRFHGQSATFLQQSLYMYFSTLMDLWAPHGETRPMPYGWFVAFERNIGRCVDDKNLPVPMREFLERQPLARMVLESLHYSQFQNLVRNFQMFRQIISRELSPRR